MKKQNKIEKASTYLGTYNEVSGMGSGRPKHYPTPTAMDLPYQSEIFFLERQDFVRIKYLRVTFSFIECFWWNLFFILKFKLLKFS